MKKTFLYLFIFIIFSLNSQELKITEYDTTADYYEDLYQLQIEKEKDDYFKKDFILKKPILVSYKCFNNRYRLMKIHEVDYKSYEGIQYRGIIIYGMYYLFPILDYYKLRYDWEESAFLYDVLHIDADTVPKSLKCPKCKENIIKNKKVIKEICKCKKNWRKIIDFIKKNARLSISSINHKYTCEKKIELHNKKLAKIINFYESYGDYDLKDRYIFTIILEE